jgi:hypothetical protein
MSAVGTPLTSFSRRDVMTKGLQVPSNGGKMGGFYVVVYDKFNNNKLVDIHEAFNPEQIEAIQACAQKVIGDHAGPIKHINASGAHLRDGSDQAHGKRSQQRHWEKLEQAVMGARLQPHVVKLGSSKSKSVSSSSLSKGSIPPPSGSEADDSDAGDMVFSVSKSSVKADASRKEARARRREKYKKAKERIGDSSSSDSEAAKSKPASKLKGSDIFSSLVGKDDPEFVLPEAPESDDEAEVAVVYSADKSSPKKGGNDGLDDAIFSPLSADEAANGPKYDKVKAKAPQSKKKDLSGDDLDDNWSAVSSAKPAKDKAKEKAKQDKSSSARAGLFDDDVDKTLAGYMARFEAL